MSQFSKPPTCPSCNADAGEEHISIHSGIGATNFKGFVHVAWAGLRAQFTPPQARVHAMRLLEAADAAESDQAVFHLLRKRVKLDAVQAAAVVGDLRHFRDTKELYEEDDTTEG